MLQILCIKISLNKVEKVLVYLKISKILTDEPLAKLCIQLNGINSLLSTIIFHLKSQMESAKITVLQSEVLGVGDSIWDMGELYHLFQ